MSLDKKIESKRAELRQITRQLETMKGELHLLFQQKAESICPISTGTKVEYEQGKWGQVDCVGYHVNFINEFDSTAEVRWTVSGRKFNKDGQFGKKDFHSVGPATHYISGTSFRPKGLSDIFDIIDNDT